MSTRYFKAASESMKITVSTGNLKLHDVGVFNLPARITCPGKTPLCQKYCYAWKAEHIHWTGVLPCREHNLESSLSKDFVSIMIQLIGSTGIAFFRIHESGDFFNQRYLEQWIDVVQNLPHVKFAAYTKCFHLDFRKSPDNMKLLWSVWPDTDQSGVPPGQRAFTIFPEQKLGGGIKNPEIGNAVACNGKCGPGRCLECWEGSGNVAFHLH